MTRPRSRPRSCLPLSLLVFSLLVILFNFFIFFFSRSSSSSTSSSTSFLSSADYLNHLRSSTRSSLKRFDDHLWSAAWAWRLNSSSSSFLSLPKMSPETLNSSYASYYSLWSDHLDESTNSSWSGWGLSDWWGDANRSDTSGSSVNMMINQWAKGWNETVTLLEMTKNRFGQYIPTPLSTDDDDDYFNPGDDQINAGDENEKKVSALSRLKNLFSSFRKSSSNTSTTSSTEEVTAPVGRVQDCIASFPPYCDMNPYVRFWKKQFNANDCYKSPLLKLRRSEKNMFESHLQRYVVFQPDLGGWNNIRMAAETAMVFAITTGRTLVLPPNMTFYLLNKNGNAKLDTSSFWTYFDLNKITDLVDIISMPEFLSIFSQYPDNALPLHESPESLGSTNRQKLWNYLENKCFTRDYHAGRMFFGFNVTKDASSNQGVRFGSIIRDERVRRMASHDRELVEYNASLDAIPCIYFPGDQRNKYRLLTHFYSFLFWAKEHEERKYKRLVRDRLHYSDPIFCAAGRVVQLLQADSLLLGRKPFPSSNRTQEISSRCRCSGFWKSNAVGGSHPTFETCHDLATLGGDVRCGPTYFAMHIRRGDFQYGETRKSATEIWNNVKHLLNSSISRLLYISTDEKNEAFFEPFREEFEVKLLRQYSDRAGLQRGAFNQNYIGMVEQVICANAHTFIGTPLSTFTGYITRMRGYYRDGRYANTFYFMPSHMYQLHTTPNLKGPFWAREFAVGHRDVDDDRNQGFATVRPISTNS